MVQLTEDFIGTDVTVIVAPAPCNWVDILNNCILSPASPFSEDWMNFISDRFNGVFCIKNSPCNRGGTPLSIQDPVVLMLEPPR
jgi:hypothetical protein